MNGFGGVSHVVLSLYCNSIVAVRWCFTDALRLLKKSGTRRPGSKVSRSVKKGSVR